MALRWLLKLIEVATIPMWTNIEFLCRYLWLKKHLLLDGTPIAHNIMPLLRAAVTRAALLLCYYRLGVDAAPFPAVVSPKMLYGRLGTGFVHRFRRPIATSLHLSKRDDKDNDHTVSNIAIIGGGLAGLSTSYHLLDIASGDSDVQKRLHITIFDKAEVGEGGASSVAGG